jgi:hypothetical protein
MRVKAYVVVVLGIVLMVAGAKGNGGTDDHGGTVGKAGATP